VPAVWNKQSYLKQNGSVWGTCCCWCSSSIHTKQDPANFPDLAKVLRDLPMKGFCPGHVLSLSCLGPKSIVWIYGHNLNRAHIWSYTCQLGGRMQQAWNHVYHFQQPGTLSSDAFRSLSHKVKAINNTSCVFLCLYCLGFWVFLSTHVHPCQIILQLYHIFPVRFLVTRDFPPLRIRFLITSRHGISLVTHGTCLVTRVRSKKLSTT
jgi:hypothetical protein